jgi:putative transposase
MRFALVDEEKSHHPISRVARVLGVTAAGYYAWKSRPISSRAAKDAQLKERILAFFEASRGNYGVPRIHKDLTVAGEHISRKRVARLMRELGIAGVSGHEGRRKGSRKTAAAESDPVTDLVKRRFTADEPNRVWFADITFVLTWEGWLFLAVLMDACTKRIVGLFSRRSPPTTAPSSIATGRWRRPRGSATTSPHRTTPGSAAPTRTRTG